jgi:hypothetical protein
VQFLGHYRPWRKGTLQLPLPALEAWGALPAVLEAWMLRAPGGRSILLLVPQGALPNWTKHDHHIVFDTEEEEKENGEATDANEPGQHA